MGNLGSGPSPKPDKIIIGDQLQRCDSCQRHANIPDQPPHEMVSMLRLIPFYQRGVDIVGDLPRMPWGKRYAIVEVDYFTKWVEARPLTRQDQEQVYQLLREIFNRFGVSQVLVTDNGTQYTTGRIEDLFLELDIEHITTSVLYHQANGQVEVMNRLNLDLLEEKRDVVVDKMARHKGTITAYYNKRVRVKQFLVGDLVLRAINSSAHGKPGKLECP
ncbi:hypothetical protein LIER_38536 [Lithospermum erythrorhizon]|uniref:Integrase catalytic domain-containing protein n=1 Tax=Lithospermum erythrorhizon TaxID=34254 RepID=A0AAV3Q5W6_LITER